MTDHLGRSVANPDEKLRAGVVALLGRASKIEAAAREVVREWEERGDGKVRASVAAALREALGVGDEAGPLGPVHDAPSGYDQHPFEEGCR